jgi:hypothetical protein
VYVDSLPILSFLIALVLEGSTEELRVNFSFKSSEYKAVASRSYTLPV